MERFVFYSTHRNDVCSQVIGPVSHVMTLPMIKSYHLGRCKRELLCALQPGEKWPRQSDVGDGFGVVFRT
jgi:hypothetical protein